MSSLVKKCIKVDKNTTDYLRLFEQEPYSTIRQLFDGAQQQLLIDDQLNKLGKMFVKNHVQIPHHYKCFGSTRFDCFVLQKLHLY